MSDGTNKRADAELLAHRILESARPHLIDLICSVMVNIEPLPAESEAQPAAINDKDTLSTAEAALLLGCSESHVRNLVERARKKQSSVPIPFQDLDGILRFPQAQLVEWRDKPKPRMTKAGKDKSHLAVVSQ